MSKTFRSPRRPSLRLQSCVEVRQGIEFRYASAIPDPQTKPCLTNPSTRCLPMTGGGSSRRASPGSWLRWPTTCSRDSRWSLLPGPTCSARPVRSRRKLSSEPATAAEVAWNPARYRPSSRCTAAMRSCRERPISIPTWRPARCARNWPAWPLVPVGPCVATPASRCGWASLAWTRSSACEAGEKTAGSASRHAHWEQSPSRSTIAAGYRSKNPGSRVRAA